MWQAILEEMDEPLEVVMEVLGIPLRDKDLGERAARALEARLAEPNLPLEDLIGDLPGEVRGRVEALAELLLYLGAEGAFRRWMDAYYRAKRWAMGVEEEP
ncbi:hypothetical protein [Thermus sediminis]|uniref:hypothetical protein n=1 Tax=Thermus sediminis TaxID=1761908 RepID=UPI000E3C08ED|nr:hypothetical protein [Thermus sediminis]